MCLDINETINDLEIEYEPTSIKPDKETDAKWNDKTTLRNILRRNKTAFLNTSGQLRLNTHYATHIILKDNATWLVIKPYRIPYNLLHKMDKIIDDLVKQDVIEETEQSSWQSPIFPVVKVKDKAKGEINYRLLQDFRGVSLAIKSVTFVASVVATIIDWVSRGHTNVMSAINIKCGFGQQTLYKDDRFVTAFISHDGHQSVWKCTLMGCQPSPLLFHNMKIY